MILSTIIVSFYDFEAFLQQDTLGDTTFFEFDCRACLESELTSKLFS